LPIDFCFSAHHWVRFLFPARGTCEKRRFSTFNTLPLDWRTKNFTPPLKKVVQVVQAISLGKISVFLNASFFGCTTCTTF
jgi:hypothetical protein